jgi:TPR repeat protein
MRRRPAVLLVLGFALLSTSAFTQTTTLGTDAPRIFEKGMNALSGVGVSTSDLNAVDYFRRSAELGYAPAQVVLGSFYDTGSHVPQDSGAAADWYKKAAKQDDRVGDWLLGRLYYTGNGIPRDLAAAETWLQKAASQGDPYGQYLLGMVKLERNDYVNGALWFRKAAMQGMPQAQQQLGELLKDGKGVDADKPQAYVWLLVSYDAGNHTTGAALQVLEAALSTSQVAEAKTKARELEQTVTRAAVARGCTGWPGEFGAVPAPPPPDIQNFCR